MEKLLRKSVISVLYTGKILSSTNESAIDKLHSITVSQKFEIDHRVFFNKVQEALINKRVSYCYVTTYTGVQNFLNDHRLLLITCKTISSTKESTIDWMQL